MQRSTSQVKEKPGQEEIVVVITVVAVVKVKKKKKNKKKRGRELCIITLSPGCICLIDSRAADTHSENGAAG